MTSDTSVDSTVVVDALVVSSEEIVSVAFVVGSFVTTTTASVVVVAFGIDITSVSTAAFIDAAALVVTSIPV